MRLEDSRKSWAVWDNPFVVDFNRACGITESHFDLGLDTTVFLASSSVERIPILAGLRVMKKLSWVPFGALSVRHAGRAGVDTATWAMNHVFDDYLIQTGIPLRVRQLCTDDAVYLVCLDFVFQPYQDMRMWQSSFLPFNGIHPASRRSKYVALGYYVHQHCEFLFKHSCQQIMAVGMSLAIQQFSLNFLPLGVASECYEQVGSAVVSHICHSILRVLVHVAWASSERGWEDY